MSPENLLLLEEKKVLESLKFSSMVMEANDESSSISPIFMLLFARSSG